MKFDINKIYKENYEEILKTISEFIAVESYFEQESKTKENPFGSKIANMFNVVTTMCEKDNISYRNIDNYALEITLGESTPQTFGILAHLDTVPVQENWDSNPFELTKRENWYYGLGSSDDKGPAAILYVLIKYLNNLNLKYKRQLKLILGGSEERGFECLYYYFDKNPQMTYGVSPDADFPGINFEKSAYNFKFNKKFENNLKTDFDILIKGVNSGTALNVVPQYTFIDVICKNLDILDKLINKIKILGGEIITTDNLNLTFKLIGKPSHGMQPHLGINSLYLFLNLIKEFKIDSNFNQILNDFEKYLLDDCFGKKLGISCENEYGNTTNNLGLFKYENNEVEFCCNIRYTNALNTCDVVKQVTKCFDSYEITYDGKEYHYISSDNYIYKQAKKSYESVTKKEFIPQSTGGGTYARMLKNGLAFGPSIDFETNMHQNNERISEKSIEATFKIYLELINNVCIES